MLPTYSDRPVWPSFCRTAEAKGCIENLNPQQALTEYESGVAFFVDIRHSEQRKAGGAIPGSHHPRLRSRRVSPV